MKRWWHDKKPGVHLKLDADQSKQWVPPQIVSDTRGDIGKRAKLMARIQSRKTDYLLLPNGPSHLEEKNVIGDFRNI